MASPRVLVLGGINMGLITRAETLPAPGQTLRGERFYSSPGGKGGTQAVAASRQGGCVKMVGRVGDDLFGPALLESLRSHEVDTSDVAVDPKAASGVGVILVDGSGQNRVLATYGANLRCGGEQLRAVEAALPETDVLLLQMEIPSRRIAAGGEGRQGPQRPRHPRPGPGGPHPRRSLRGLRHHRAEPDGSGVPGGRRRG